MNKVIKSSLNKSNLEGGFPREAIEYPSSSSEEEQDQFERIETKVLSNKDELQQLMEHRQSIKELAMCIRIPYTPVRLQLNESMDFPYELTAKPALLEAMGDKPYTGL